MNSKLLSIAQDLIDFASDEGDDADIVRAQFDYLCVVEGLDPVEVDTLSGLLRAEGVVL